MPMKTMGMHSTTGNHIVLVNQLVGQSSSRRRCEHTVVTQQGPALGWADSHCQDDHLALLGTVEGEDETKKSEEVT